MSTLDTGIVNVALPRIAQELHGSLAQISWVVVAYLLTNTSSLLTSGRLGDLLPPGRLYLLGLLVFTGASALCGLSPGLPWLVASRTLQGLGASLILGLAPKLVALSYGEGERGLALGLFSTAFATGISVGAPLGGVITSHLGWPYIFFINIPICGLALILGGPFLARLPASAAWDWRKVDLWGSLTLAGSLAFLLLTLHRVQDSGWGNLWTLGALGLAATFFLLLLFLEGRQTAPLLHRELWESRPFVVGSVAVVLTFAAVMGTFFLLPFFLEQIYGYSPDQTGFLLAVVSVTNAAVAPGGGHLADRWGNVRVLRLGTGLILLGLGTLLFTGPGSSTGSLVTRFALIGMGFGLFQAPNLNEILLGVKPSLIGLAASTNAVLKNIGALLGITLIVTVFGWVRQHQLCLGIANFHLAFAPAVIIAVINVVTNLIPRRSKSLASRRQSSG